MEGNPVNPIGVSVEFVITKLVLHVKHDRNATSYADCKSDDVYERECLMVRKISQRNAEIVPQHKLPVIINLQ
jgi:hypothetical protein